jgi:hypothetical protein
MSDLMKGKHFYELMPVDLQIIYLERISDDHLAFVYDTYFENFVQFLSESFIWHETPEGYDFWLDVSKYNFHETI